jgi:hypothetical protein
VFPRLSVVYTRRGPPPHPPRRATPLFVAVPGGRNSEYTVPGGGGPGSIHEESRTWQLPWDGYLVGAGGHLHGGGIDIGLRHDPSGLECTMTAEYMHGHHDPWSIEVCPFHVRVEEGTDFSVIARYDNEEQITGAMGIVMAYVWEGTQ